MPNRRSIQYYWQLNRLTIDFSMGPAFLNVDCQRHPCELNLIEIECKRMERLER